MNEITLIEAGIFSGIGGFLSERAFEAMGAMLIIAVGMLTKRYIIPLLQTIRARQIALHVFTIADDVTDYFAERFPNAHWSNWLDRAVDKIIDVTGVGKGPAERAVRAAITRKKDRLPADDAKLEGRS